MGNFIFHVCITVANFVLLDKEFVLQGPHLLPVNIPIRIRIAIAP